ncbi:MAG: HIT domain-containing protein [Ardenticatenaceae bacterium]|nr:HIT domain-containing protein [Ardenticatenaceae bacterium]
MKWLRRGLFKLARSSLVGWIVGWLFAHMSFVIPVDRLRETETLIVFHHPKPSHPVHILLVPKRQLPNLLAIDPAEADFFADLYRIVQELVVELALEKPGYTLLVNGGAYQDVPQLHFHLISGRLNDG